MQRTVPRITFEIIPPVTMKQEKWQKHSKRKNLRTFCRVVCSLKTRFVGKQRRQSTVTIVDASTCYHSRNLKSHDLKTMFERENSESRDTPPRRLVQGRVAEERLQRKLIPSRTSTADNRFILISRKRPTEVNPGGTICYDDATFYTFLAAVYAAAD